MIGKFSGKANFDIEWVGALSVEEYEAGKEFIPKVKGWGWLRSPGATPDRAAYVFPYGGVYAYGDYVFYDTPAARPALRIGNLAALKFRPGDKVEIAGITWTVISENLVLSDELIGKTAFNKDIRKGNEYHGSDLEKYILTWWEERSKG